jgi:hypothetical protein
MKINEYIKHNLELYKTYEEKIKSGWWNWHIGIITRFKCVKCGQLLKGSDYLTNYIKNKGEEACQNLTCWNCHNKIKK